MKEKFTNEDLTRILMSHLRLMESRILQRHNKDKLESIKDYRNKFMEDLFAMTFGSFFAVLTALNIGEMINMQFPKNILSIFCLFLTWGIGIIAFKLYFIEKDREINKIKNAIEKDDKMLKIIEKKTKEAEDIANI